MTADDFRALALALPEAVEQAHMGHPDFRVGGTIFATLGYPDGSRGMVKLTPDQQEVLVRSKPATFVAVPGGWGRKGATHVLLATAEPGVVQDALALAWRNTAPRRLVELHPDL